MKRKAIPAQVSTSQLELPLGQQGAAKDLAYYIGLGKVFAAYHKRWPTADSSREEFRAARIQDYDGQRIDRELRFPSPALEADPAYQALRERCLVDGAANGVNLAALDPRYRSILHEGTIAELFETITLPGQAGPGTVRYATGAPAHAQGELTLHVGEALRARALRRAGLDPDDPRMLAASFSLRVRATDALKSFIERIGVRQPSGEEGLADHYLLDASDQGRLSVQYQLLSGNRYAGKFDVRQLTEKLAAIYAADPRFAGLGASTIPDQPPAPAARSIDELHEQLAMLEPDGRSLKLPIQQLRRFAEIRRALEQAGGIYVARQQRFDFEEGVDPARVLARLLSGGVT